MKLLIVSPSSQIRDEFAQALPLGWGLDSVKTAEEALQALDTSKPDLVVTEQVLPGMSGISLLQQLAKRQDPPPASVLVTPPVMDEKTQAMALSLRVQEILPSPVDEEAVQRIFAPYRLVDGPLNMSLLEFLVTGYTEMSNRQLDLTAAGHKISLVFGMGYIWAILHPLFSDRYRNALAAAGYALPPTSGDDLLDQAAVEERLGPSPQLAALKQHTVLSILASLPLHLNFHARIAEVIIPEGLIPLDIPAVVVPLVEHVPESALAPLRVPGLRLGRRREVIPADLPIQPHQGFLLSACQEPTAVAQLVQMGALSEQKVLSGVYLLLLLGLLVSEPSVGQPFRLSGLEREMENESMRIRRQATAIQGLVNSFQLPGRSPYDILGIPNTAGPRQAVEAYQIFQDRLSPQKIHPDVYRKHYQDIMLLKAKLGEAFLLLQSSFLKDRRLAQDADALAKGLSHGGADSAATQGQVQKKEAEKLVAMAREFLAGDSPFDAGQCLKLAILYDPTLAPAHHLMGKVFVQQKDARSKHMAERKFLEAIQLNPWDIDVHMDLTELYLQQGLMARCRACFNRAQRMDPRHPRVLDLRDAVKLAEKEK
jgi:CheY-like chemotaxis protein/tetratricopeptide (TPR) repeat protein